MPRKHSQMTCTAFSLEPRANIPLKTQGTGRPLADYKYGCEACEWWDECGEPDFGNCPLCGQPKTVWNMTDAEAETDHELMLEEQLV